jgi:glycosyltransferase involved in cell wall biosynthesis
VLLVAAATSTTGGGEKHVADLLEAFSGRLELGLACPPGGDLATHAARLGVRTFQAPIASGFSAAHVRALRAALLAEPWDVVHAHGSRAAAFARLADARARRRVVYHLHGVHVDRAGTAARRNVLVAVERTLRARTARFVAVCSADASRAARLGVAAPQRTVVVPNGVDVPPVPATRGRFRAEIGAAPQAPLVLCVGRFHAQKDHATLLEAWRIVARARPDAVLALVGAGELEAHLREHAASTGVGASVRFVAPRRDLGDAYADADIFALSSRWEGLPYTVLEAMAHGLPVVSTAVDGVPEAVADGKTGLLVRPQDPAALAAALAALLAEPARGLAFGAAGRARIAAHFSRATMIERILAVYEDVAR